MGRTDELGAESRGQTFRFDPEKLVLITDPKHKLYQQTAVDAPPQWMIDSAFHYGIKVPITLRKGAKHRGKYKMEVIVGRRRVLALRAANKLRKAKELNDATRATVADAFGYANTDADIDHVLATLPPLVERLRALARLMQG